MSFTYKGLSAQLNKHTVTDAELDKQIERLQMQNPRIAVITDRPTQAGDEVVLDYAGFCDGTQFAGGTAENQTLVLGSGMFIPGFEEQLLDKVPEEPVIVKVTFPKEYHAPELAGKEAEFHCTIHEIRVKTQYDLDDVFAQEIGGCYTFAEMRQQLRKSMQDFTDQRGEMDLQDRLLRQAAATLTYTVDPQALENAVSEQLQNLEAQLAQQGLNLKMYCDFMKTTEEVHYDFTKLSGWEYVEAMDSDTASRNVFQVSKKQALALFAAAAAKQAPVDDKGGRLYDAADIKQRISLFDAQRAVQVATVFLVRSAQEAGKNTYGE